MGGFGMHRVAMHRPMMMHRPFVHRPFLHRRFVFHRRMNLEIYKDFRYVRALRTVTSGEAITLIKLTKGTERDAAKTLPEVMHMLKEVSGLRKELATFIRKQFPLERGAGAGR